MDFAATKARKRQRRVLRWIASRLGLLVNGCQNSSLCGSMVALITPAPQSLGRTRLLVNCYVVLMFCDTYDAELHCNPNEQKDIRSSKHVSSFYKSSKKKRHKRHSRIPKRLLARYHHPLVASRARSPTT